MAEPATNPNNTCTVTFVVDHSYINIEDLRENTLTDVAEENIATLYVDSFDKDKTLGSIFTREFLDWIGVHEVKAVKEVSLDNNDRYYALSIPIGFCPSRLRVVDKIPMRYLCMELSLEEREMVHHLLTDKLMRRFDEVREFLKSSDKEIRKKQKMPTNS
jgi:hypothetical protein